MKNFIKKYSNIIIIVLLMLFLFLLIDSIIGKSILSKSAYCSYELQANAWLKGRTFLDHNYEYLELAIYNGKYFVSFPPFPSAFLFPFVFIFRDNIPTNLISFILFVTSFILAYKIVKRYNKNDLVAILLAFGITVGSNLLSLAVDSGVWFFAQILNNCLCLFAINAFLNKKRWSSYFYLALAVGCRPFSAIYMIMFFIYYVTHDDNKQIYKKILNNIRPLIPAMVVAIIYMIYNYIRFDNVLEFGHNYLPEFVRAEHGQFSFHYLWPNIKEFFSLGIKFDDNYRMSFNKPFCYIIANPVILLYYYRVIKNFIKERKVDFLRLLILLFTTLNIILICMHRTLGAWQFGARYSCDILPFVFLGILLYQSKGKEKIELDKFEIMCIIFGVILNLYGVIIMYID